MSGDRELAAVTGASGAATSGAEQRGNRKGETSNPCDYDRSLCGLAFLSSPDGGAGYTGGITNGPTPRFRLRSVRNKRSKVTTWTSTRKTVFFQVSKLFEYGCMTAVETRSRPIVRDGNTRTPQVRRRPPRWLRRSRLVGDCVLLLPLCGISRCLSKYVKGVRYVTMWY